MAGTTSLPVRKERLHELHELHEPAASPSAGRKGLRLASVSCHGHRHIVYKRRGHGMSILMRGVFMLFEKMCSGPPSAPGFWHSASFIESAAGDRPWVSRCCRRTVG